MAGPRHYGRWVLGAMVVLPALVLALGLATPLPELAPWRSGPPPGWWAAANRQLEVWQASGVKQKLRFTYVPLDQVSDHLLLAVLVGEDINFFDHSGVDVRAWSEALQQWMEGGRLRGASTLTQQLAKNLFLSRERTLRRKLKELCVAWQLERQLGKRRILELYVNVTEFGPGLFGVQAAAEAYFHCTAEDLNPDQAAALAATIPSPSRDNPKTNTARFRARKRIIAQRASQATWLVPLLRQVKGQ
ncbi:MAG: monofunctional biosynthetic peptidoglycan transglycosylase [Thermoanaerobaculum sp.]|nr:monofunctional biosynthetic peptidoglycan transglycosylase [Thermoanaerobaculum sp.]MDW7966953.1 monofunctional biosynthetic peptidoglycan transglycosylase [Thermoanaerobaculum sp.]